MNKSNNYFLLKDIGEIQSGYLFKSRVENVKEGNIRVIQLKDMDDSGRLHLDNLAAVKMDNIDQIKNRYRLKKGDVLFKAKSNKNAAGVLNQVIGIIIPTVHFLIIKVKDAPVLPEYLAWFMNQKPARKYYEARSAGTTIPIINKKILEGLEIKVPPLKIQKKIVAVFNLFLKEKEIMEQLIDKRKQFIEDILLKVVKNEI